MTCVKPGIPREDINWTPVLRIRAQIVDNLLEPNMKCNVGKVDRTLRIVVGAALVGWALMGGPVWAWIGVLPLATGILGICPAYSLLGFTTCPAEKRN